jgi:hypothetical protein
MTEPFYPDASLKNNGVALRVNFEWPSIDGSVSYFNGFNPSLGIDLVSIDSSGSTPVMNVAPRAYRQHIIGADFSTTISNYGFRGEFTYRYPHDM